MTSPDPLEGAIDALRESVRQPPDGGEASLVRIQSKLTPHASRFGWKAPAAAASGTAVVVALLAWFALSSSREAPPSRAPSPPPAGAMPQDERDHLASESPRTAVPMGKEEGEAAAEEGAEPEPSPSRRAYREPPRASRSAPRTRKVAPSQNVAARPPPLPTLETPDNPPRPTMDDRRSTQRFREIHRLQFTASPERVLQAWERYLQDEPTAELAVEAHYHRAVLLKRLGRERAAREALLPFARGDHGPRRQASARRLLGEGASKAR